MAVYVDITAERGRALAVVKVTLLVNGNTQFSWVAPKKLLGRFLNKGWGLQGLNKLFKKLQETGTMARRSGSIESI